LFGTLGSQVTQSESVHDLLVIGGGINGTGIAADAAGRGLDVVLCEKSDLASATSSASSKLIHGGLRYLEFYEFSMVRKSLLERELLTKAAHHIIKPLVFQIPRLPHSRNFWMLRAGLFLYDNLARRHLYKGSRSVKYSSDSPLNSAIRRGFEYWDGQVDDSRLVVLNALQASRKGAAILTRTECTEINSTAQGWRITLRDHRSNSESVQVFKVVVNATGP
jgi:glycerol-3-phosphate dehydrogenase